MGTSGWSAKANSARGNRAHQDKHSRRSPDYGGAAAVVIPQHSGLQAGEISGFRRSTYLKPECADFMRSNMRVRSQYENCCCLSVVFAVLLLTETVAVQ